MAVKEMPLEEKYSAIFDMYILETAASYAFHKEQGTLNKWLDYTVESYRAYMGPMVEMMKTLASGKPFKQAINQLASMQQTMQPLSEIELSWVSDREVAMRFKNCEILRRSKGLAKKLVLILTPNSFAKWIGTDTLTPTIRSKRSEWIRLASLKKTDANGRSGFLKKSNVSNESRKLKLWSG